MKAKIKEHYKTGFASSPVEVSKEEIDYIIINDCKCQCCGKNIFKIDDFPKIDISKDIFLCEHCFDDEFRDICPICEESYLIEDCKGYEVRVEDEPKGIYLNDKFVVRIDVNKYKSIDCDGNICSECSENLHRI